MPKSQIARPVLSLLLITASASLVTYSQAPSAGKTNSDSLTVPGEKASGQCPPAHLWRHQRRSLFFRGRQIPDLHALRRRRSVRPDVHHAGGYAGRQTRRAQTGEHGQGTHDVRLLFPKGDRILFSSTHETSAACPPRPDYSHGYVWPIYNSYEIYTAKPDGSDLRRSDPFSRTATTRNRPSAATARKSSSHPRATATSTFTR